MKLFLPNLVEAILEGNNQLSSLALKASKQTILISQISLIGIASACRIKITGYYKYISPDPKAQVCGLSAVGQEHNTSLISQNSNKISKRRIGILMVGDNCAGKTACLERYLRNYYYNSGMGTIGVNCEHIKYQFGDLERVLLFCDIAGQERFESIAQNYTKSASFLLAFINLTHKRSLTRALEWLEVAQGGGFNYVSKMLVVGNYKDRHDARKISYYEGLAFAEAHGAVGYIECSAKTGEGVREVIDSAAQLACCCTVGIEPTSPILDKIMAEQKQEAALNEVPDSGSTSGTLATVGFFASQGSTSGSPSDASTSASEVSAMNTPDNDDTSPSP